MKRHSKDVANEVNTPQNSPPQSDDGPVAIGTPDPIIGPTAAVLLTWDGGSTLTLDIDPPGDDRIGKVELKRRPAGNPAATGLDTVLPVPTNDGKKYTIDLNTTPGLTPGDVLDFAAEVEFLTPRLETGDSTGVTVPAPPTPPGS